VSQVVSGVFRALKIHARDAPLSRARGYNPAIMIKKILLGLFAILILGSLGLFLWARSVFTHDNVRTTLAAELSEALGQPVTIDSIGASIYPRVTVKLGDVAIGKPAGVQIASLDLGTDFRALLSRRIEHASARVEGARIQLPLLPLGRSADDGPESSPSSAPVELVSIDEIVLSDVEILSGGRTLRGDIEAIPEADGAVTLRRVSLTADDATIEATGRITNLNGPTGDLAIEAGELHLDRLIAFFNDFAATATTSSTASVRPAASTAKPDLNVSITATRAHMAGLTLDALTTRAHVTETGVLLKPMTFGIFGGKYDGSVGIRTAASGGAPAFTYTATVADLDIGAALGFAGVTTKPITGRLSGQIELTGAGADASAAMRSVRGRARVSVADGIVRSLGLVRAIVVATSMRGGAGTAIVNGATATSAATASPDEPFKTLSATLAIAGNRATTDDLRLEGTNVLLRAGGSLALNGSAVNLSGRVQLSDELTSQAGTDLVRYTREDGRVTLPVTVTGSTGALTVRIDVGDMLKRAIRNRAEDEAKKAIMKGLGGLFKKPPK
jgi:uncharacterized protein involved in outer membrane biogenesis